MHNNILIGQEAQDKLINGVNKLADAVKITMGAKGKLVIIEDKNGMVPSLTKDGATVADSVKSSDPHEELGIKMLREATYRSLEEVADGTTTATVLGQALINNSKNSNNPEELLKDLPLVLKEIDKLSKRATDKQLKQVAVLASNGDKEIGSLVSKAFKAVGKNGYVGVENTTFDKTTLDIKDGFTIDSGLISPYFATDARSMECHLENPSVVVVRDKIGTMNDIIDIIRVANEQQTPFLLFSKDISEEVLQTILYNNQQGKFKIVWCRIPDNEDKQDLILTDICFASSCEPYSVYSKGFTTANIGTLESATLRRGSSSLISSVDMSDYVKELESNLETTELDSFLRRRIKNLNSKLVTIKVGGITDLDLKERRDRIDDAVGAVKSATKSGIVAGAGNTLSYIASKLGEKISEPMRLALKVPQYVILKNADIDVEPSLFNYDKGFDVSTGELKKSLIESGIVDSSFSVKNSLESAVHVAVNILNTKGSICH